MSRAELIESLSGGLIVSCQAPDDDPLSGPEIMARMARAVAVDGVVAIRAEGPDDVAAIRASVSLPVIGLWKDGRPGDVYITPTVEHALAVADAGAAVIAVDGTGRRPDGQFAELVRRLRSDADVCVMADVATVADARAAVEGGADLVATTLSGYTSHSRARSGPDLALVEELAGLLEVPVIAEGRIADPATAREALERGAWAVVVGTAITRPGAIAERFVAGLRDG